MLPALVFSASSASAADSVTGTFTVKGKTHLFKQVAVTKTSNPAEPGSRYLVVLVSDVAVAAADQKPARLADSRATASSGPCAWSGRKASIR